MFVLLYGFTTSTKYLEDKEIDDNYIGIFHASLYKTTALQPLTIQIKRVRLDGHCRRKKKDDEHISAIIL